jgi:hypothetical protein
MAVWCLRKNQTELILMWTSIKVMQEGLQDNKTLPSVRLRVVLTTFDYFPNFL